MKAIQSRKPDVTRDLDYEETVKRIDDDSESSEEEDNKEHVLERIRKLVDKPIEKPVPRKAIPKKATPKSSATTRIKTEREAAPTPDRSNRASSSRTIRGNSSPFVPPEGSQVVNIVTSSPEPELVEHYAEDDIDGTYQEPSLPAGAGWVKKERARWGVSVPASSISAAREAAVPKRFASSQSSGNKQGGADKRSSASLASLLRAKKKALGNRY
jgi:hypothetical protein